MNPEHSIRRAIQTHINQSQEPSAGPSFHRVSSAAMEQGNVGLFKFRFTSLCSLQNHKLKLCIFCFSVTDV